jgi:hypothetical protein
LSAVSAESFRRELDQPARRRERERMPDRVRGREVERRGLARDRGGDSRPAMASVHAPQRREAVEDLPPVGGREVHVLRRDHEPRRLLERTARRERHPVGVEVERAAEVAGIGHDGDDSSVAAPKGADHLSPAGLGA